MKALQKLSKWLSDYTSIVVIAIAVVTFIVPGMMGWVNHQLFTDPVSNKFTSQSIIIGIINILFVISFQQEFEYFFAVPSL